MNHVIMFVYISIILSEVNPLTWLNGCFEFKEDQLDGYSVVMQYETNEAVPCSNNETYETSYKKLLPKVKSIKYEHSSSVDSFEFNADFLARCENLEKLDVSSLGFGGMRNASVTMKTINTKYFNASQNLLKKVPRDIFLHMPSLKKIDLSFNQISTLNNDDFKYTGKLEALFLMNNKMYLIYAFAFSKLSSLEILDLSNNRLNVERELIDRFKNNTQLRLLNLRGNALKIFSFSLLSSETKSVEVYLPLEIETLDMSCLNNEKCPSSIELKNVEVLENLKIFNASQNNFTDISKLLSNLTGKPADLVTLDLSWNHIEVLNEHVLEKFQELRHLNLSHSNIHSINKLAFNNQIYLLELDLSYNNLKVINCETIPKTIISLNLESNALNIINTLTPQKFRKLDMLAINKNPFDCNILKDFFQQWKVYSIESKTKIFRLVNNSTTKDVNIDGVDCDPEVDASELKSHAGKEVVIQTNDDHNWSFNISGFTLYILISGIIICILITTLVTIICVIRQRQFARPMEMERRPTESTIMPYHITTVERFDRVNRFNTMPFSNQSEPNQPNEYEEIKELNSGGGYSVPADVISISETPQSSDIYSLPYGYQLYSTVKKPKTETKTP